MSDLAYAFLVLMFIAVLWDLHALRKQLGTVGLQSYKLAVRVIEMDHRHSKRLWELTHVILELHGHVRELRTAVIPLELESGADEKWIEDLRRQMRKDMATERHRIEDAEEVLPMHLDPGAPIDHIDWKEAAQLTADQLLAAHKRRKQRTSL